MVIFGQYDHIIVAFNEVHLRLLTGVRRVGEIEAELVVIPIPMFVFAHVSFLASSMPWFGFLEPRFFLEPSIFSLGLPEWWIAFDAAPPCDQCILDHLYHERHSPD